MDDLGRVPQNAVWAVDDPAIASITTTPRPELTALAAGEVTVTATWQGLSAVTHITVSALETLLAGTTTWSAPPIHGTVKKILHGSFGADGSRLTYVLESTGEPGSHDLIRAFDGDGAEQWVRAMPGLVAELTGDAMGGVLALYGSSTPGEFTLTRIAGGGGGSGITVDSAPNLSGFKPGTFAVHPDGPLYVVKDGALMGINVGMGAGRSASDDPVAGCVRAAVPGRLSDLAWHLPLPALALALPIAATLERLQAQSMSEAVGQPYVAAARARGLSPGDLVLRHAWRASLRPVCALYGLVIGALLSGSFAVEYVTSWPGLGRLMYEALRARDIYLVAGCAAAGALFLALGSLLSDLLLAAADPRVREGSA